MLLITAGAAPSCDAALVPEAVPEPAPADPRDVHAATKLHQEHLAALRDRAQGLRAALGFAAREDFHAGLAELGREVTAA